MLYGHIIFIKKAGGDGSKYPVSEKTVKIGRSEECLIRIYNTQVALEHCQLIIRENGQAILKDLSNQTVLNGNILAHEEATLCHGDVFKVGERLARWEYLPTSKYYRQLLSPTGRLVAVVMPQQRCLEDQPNRISASVESALKNTPVGGKKRYSERFASENASAMKRRKSSSSSLVKSSKGDLSKMLTERYSLKTLSIKSLGKSAKSSGSGDKALLNHASDPISEKLSVAKKRLRSPHKKIVILSEEIVKSASKNVPKANVEIPVGSPLKIGRSTKSTRSLSNSPSPKMPKLMSTPCTKPARLFHSEKKPKPSVRKSSVHTRELKRLSEVHTRAGKSRGNTGSPGSFSYVQLRNLEGTKILDLNAQPKPDKSIERFSEKRKKSFIKKKTPEKLHKTSHENLMNRAIDNSEGEMKIPKASEIEKAREELIREKLKAAVPTYIFEASPLNKSDVGNDSKKGRKVLHVQNKSIAAKSTPTKKTPRKSGKSVGKLMPSSSRKNLSKSLVSSSRTSAANSAAARSPKSSSVRISLRKTINLSKERISSPRRVRRKLSPSISSAEKAAKELKTSSPQKPDKNKKAALLVLGKANRKLLAQNVKVMLKQKIVKKAIKQSTTTSTGKVDNGKKKSLTAVLRQPKKKLKNKTSETKVKGENVPSKPNAAENSTKLAEVLFQSRNETGYISRGENAQEENPINASKVSEISPRSPSKFKNLFCEAPGKSLSNQYMKSESKESIYSKETKSPYGNLEKAADNFLFNSNRRCSKRLSSKNDLGRPDFVELSPTALGLMPKNVEVFKTPKSNKRRSSSLVTPKMVQSVGIIKSASTSKIGNRKNVRFSSKDLSTNSEFSTTCEKSDFDLGTYQTPDVSIDVFISPLGDKSIDSKKGLNGSPRIRFAAEDHCELGSSFRSNSEPRKCIRKLLQSPKPKSKVSSNEFQRSLKLSAFKERKQTSDPKNYKVSLFNFNSEVYTTSQNNSSDTSIKELQKLQKKSRTQKSPKHYLSDLRGVKKLLATPKAQKSPKNDLSDLRGVKKLLTTPKAQKSPKNDLSDLRGVKKLLGTPKAQKSPKNDLSDLRGVKKLLTTPKAQKSPKNDLSDLRGVKKLLATPKVQKSSKNDLNLSGVKELFRSPRVQKCPKNELSELSGIQQLLGTPKHRRSSRSNSAESKKENLSEFLVENIKSPRNQKLSKNSAEDLTRLSQSYQLGKDEIGNILNFDGVKQALKTGRSRKSVSRKSRAESKVKGGRSTLEETKNDLSDVTGVRELFERFESHADLNESLTRVPQLFSLPEEDAVSTLKGKTRARKSTTGALQKVSKMVSPNGETKGKDEYMKTRMKTRNTLKTALAEESANKSGRVKKSKTDSNLKTESTERKLTKRKAAGRTKPSEAKKSPIVKRSERIKKGTEKNGKTSLERTKLEPKQSGEFKTRKRKAAVENNASPPAKQPRKRLAAESGEKFKTASVSSEKVKTVRKAPSKAKDEMSKSLSKVQNKTSKSSKVQKKGSQSSSKKNLSDSQGNFSPIKTRSIRRGTVQQNRVLKRRASSENKISGRKKVTPVVKKSTRRR